MPVAVFIWLMSVALIVVVPSVALLFYGLSVYGSPSAAQLLQLAESPAGIVVQIVANLPAHLLTLVLVWLVVSGGGRRPFWRTIGWTWTKRLTPLAWIGLAVALWVASNALTQLVVWTVGAEETTFERLIEKSAGARFAITALAVLTAPLVEEVVYRGVLYPALQRAFGVAVGVIGVAALFIVVHVPQYWENPGLIFGLAFLSIALTIIRARTGSVLPCFIIHLVFNAISATLLLLQPSFEQPAPKPPPTASAIAITCQRMTKADFQL